MKLHIPDKPVTRGGVQAEHEFTIKTTAKAFDILSSGLYTDAILAIIRELSCNAYDAHVVAKTEKVPFELHLPNKLEPFFSIRDFGTGLSHDQVMKLYTTYFESTKTDSNDFIGALGLGSKSPFSYTTAFEVTSWYGNEQQMYSVFLNESGIPSIAHMQTQASTQPNGLRVKLAVKADDFYRFRDKAADILRFFPTKPKVFGHAGFEFVKIPSGVVSGPDWFFAPRSYSSAKFTAIQGNVPYRVNVEKLRDRMTGGEWEFFNNGSIFAHFSIGQLDVAASREEIRYDDRTVTALLCKMREVRSGLVEFVQTAMKKFKARDKWASYIALNVYSQQTFGTTRMMVSYLDPASTSITNKTLLDYVNDNRKIAFNPKDYKLHHILQHARTRKNISPRGHWTVDALEPQSNIVFAINDLKTGGMTRLNAWVDAHLHVNAVVIIRPYDLNADPKRLLAERNRILRACGNPPCVIASQLPAPVKAPRVKAEHKAFTWFEFKDSRYGRSHERRFVWNEIASRTPEAPKRGLYFALRNRGTTICYDLDERTCWDSSSYISNINAVLDLINTVKGTKFTPENVYGVSIPGARFIEKSKTGDWKNIFTLASECLDNLVPAVTFCKRLAATSSVMGFQDIIIRDSNFVAGVHSLPPTSPFRLALEPMITDHMLYKDQKAVANIAMDMDDTMNRRRMFGAIKQTPYYMSSSFDQYRLFDSININGIRGNWAAFFEYITLIDGKDKS